MKVSWTNVLHLVGFFAVLILLVSEEHLQQYMRKVYHAWQCMTVTCSPYFYNKGCHPSLRAVKEAV